MVCGSRIDAGVFGHRTRKGPVDGRAAEALGAALVVVGVVDDEPVGLARVEYVSQVRLFGFGHRQGWWFELAKPFGDR